tara:strand:- start:1750 stop:3315 length:1566 start_codon:yes stop_codon:yes gene_type:complete
MSKEFKLWMYGSTLLMLIAILTMQSCTKVNYTNDPDSLLEFSYDTLFFDSVFTTIGSKSLYLSVINIHDDAILISDVELEGGVDSQYRINIDGVGLDGSGDPILSVQEVTILPGDSMYIFVEVTVDPTSSTSSFIVEDRLRFRTNGSDQSVHLIAYGRNAVFHHQPGNWFDSNNPPEQILSCNEVWSSDLPHVIYGPIRVEPECTLTIEEGAEVYVHDGSGIWVQGGTINIEGTLNEKVVFQGDRLGDYYSDAPGQWGLEFPIEFEYEGENVYFTVSRGGIWLDRALDCNIEHAIFKNGTVGIWVDTLAMSAEYSLNIRNTIITNMTAVGLLSQGGYVNGVNNLITDCGEACGAFTLGGRINIHLTTFANYWSSSTVRQGPAVYINDWYESSVGTIQRAFVDGTEFRNCIIWGNNALLDDHDELTSSLYNASIYSSPLFNSCGVDVQDENFPQSILSDNCSTDSEPPFQSIILRDFHLEGNNTIWDGISSIPPFSAAQVSTDLDGAPRSTFSPDLGCYERN